jgi:hypothetical protein
MAITVAGATDSSTDAEMLADFSRDLKACEVALAKTPDSVALLSRRGDCHLFLSQFAKAVAISRK